MLNNYTMVFGIRFLILLSMFYFHILDDYVLQGILANLKQKEWWQKNAPAALYKYDYLCALAVHGFSWSFSISIPLLVTYWFFSSANFLAVLCFFIPFNAALHAWIDHQKANTHIICLWTDQLLHALQIIAFWFCGMIFI